MNYLDSVLYSQVNLAISPECYILSKLSWQSYNDINVSTIQANSSPWKLSKCQ